MLIEEVKTFPCIWNTKSRGFKEAPTNEWNKIMTSYLTVNGSTFTKILPQYQCIYNTNSRKSESRNTRGKLAVEVALKLEKSDLNLYMGIRNCYEETDAI